MRGRQNLKFGHTYSLFNLSIQKGSAESGKVHFKLSQFNTFNTCINILPKLNILKWNNFQNGAEQEPFSCCAIDIIWVSMALLQHCSAVITTSTTPIHGHTNVPLVTGTTGRKGRRKRDMGIKLRQSISSISNFCLDHAIHLPPPTPPPTHHLSYKFLSHKKFSLISLLQQ